MAFKKFESHGNYKIVSGQFTITQLGPSDFMQNWKILS